MSVRSIFGAIFGGAVDAANPASVAAPVIDGISQLVGLVKLPPELKAQLQAQLTAENIDLEKAELAATVGQLTGQMAIDEQEAKSESKFVAGWRPAVGWVCASAFAWSFVLQPMLGAILAAFGYKVALPALNISEMMPVLLGMLGLGGLRTFEKVNGSSTSAVKG